MKIYEFMAQYCQDIVNDVKTKKTMIDLSEFPYDEIIKDDNGNEVCVIYIDSMPVPIMDVISMSKDDFLNAYKYPHSAECFENYVSNLEILEGTDAINKVRNDILNYKESLKNDIAVLDL